MSLKPETTNRFSTAAQLLLRVAAVFSALLLLPLDWKFWRELFATHWSRFQDLFQLTAYQSNFIRVPKWGLASFGNWALALAIAVPAGAVWWLYNRRQPDESKRVLYWLIVLLRYRLAIGMIGYGMLKLFPVQFPHLTLSDLNTNYADFLPWKIYYLTNSVAAAHYREAIGAAEILSGVLLLWRRFAVIGALLASTILANIVLANFAYQIGDHVYATLLFLLSVAILLPDAKKLLTLLVLRRPTRANPTPAPALTPAWAKLQLGFKTALVLFFALYAVEIGYSHTHTQWPYSETAGLPAVEGLYNVREFSVNGTTLPYSPNDPVRWQNVVFEKWNTISIRIHRPLTIQVANPEISFAPDQQRDYELAGNGGRHFYSYDVASDGVTLRLHGKNDPKENFTFTWKHLDTRSIEMTGNDEAGNSLHIILDKTDKRYLLNEGRRHPLTLY